MPLLGGESVLVVCTANRCRSPLVAATLAYRAAEAGLPWTVGSAGVRTRSGETTEAETLEALRESGIPSARQPVRQIDEAIAAGSDLVLTAERSHRSEVLRLAPGTVGRVFTLLEFERLLEAAQRHELHSRVNTLTELAAYADSARFVAGPAGPFDDLADPVGRPLESFRETQRLVERIVARIISVAAG
jgi:protein-tyrosine phosphatase